MNGPTGPRAESAIERSRHESGPLSESKMNRWSAGRRSPPSGAGRVPGAESVLPQLTHDRRLRELGPSGDLVGRAA